MAEKKLSDLKVSEFINAVSEKKATPGGGSSSAAAGAMAAALISMVCRLSVDHAGLEFHKTSLLEALDESEGLHTELTNLISEDAIAYDEITAAFGMPKNTVDEEIKRRDCIQAAHKNAVKTPRKIAEGCLKILELDRIVIMGHNRTTTSDIGVSANLAYAGLKGAVLTMAINLRVILDPVFVDRNRRLISGMMERGSLLHGEVESAVEATLKPFPK